MFKVHYPAGGTRFEPDPAITKDLVAAVRAAQRIEVYGRTDGERASAADEAIALKRAAGARDYLVQIGADPRRIFLQYVSAADYLGDNTTAFGRSQNRRVEIHVM